MKTRLANGEPSVMHHSYQVGDSKEGKVYLKDGFYYFKEMSGKEMERFLERSRRRIFKFISKPDRRYTFKVSISDFRSLKLKDYFQIEHQKVEVDAWVVAEASAGPKKLNKKKAAKTNVFGRLVSKLKIIGGTKKGGRGGNKGDRPKR